MSDINIKKQHSTQALNDVSLDNVADGFFQVYAPSKSNKDFSVNELF